ncbi:elongation factor P maturation arginine rhamnosyltransferase EarP [Azonexus sp.]|uniref:elongation factor P maturation arginine rhamnosyltransferase EarP n=1 Tax=Azonexus sp. TaxID=1872668 RepID=UPI0027B9CFD7|nr:elongation factor P maturation arginine rhamnosyltransferase EarP [Azonexus sp.]
MGRDVNMPAMQLHWDIFCRVIDNYGDIGVCWRLARQLASEHGKKMRLWVDDLASLSPICPETDVLLAQQQVQGVEIRRWTNDFAVDRVAEVIIEAFACELPPAYVAAMAQAARPPCWINLEYLTAEPWAESCHGMASPHPTLALTKHFFFPGFSRSTGGLLRESGLPQALPATPDNQLDISLFCYETAPVGELLDQLAQTSIPVRLHVPPGKPLAAVSAHLGGHGPWQIGMARIEPIPFLAMDDYDRLLRRCDINFVRGEDSFVRAQWAGKPFIWQIYRQDDNAHLDKLTAFLDLYCAGLDEPSASVVRQVFAAWNDDRASQGNFAKAWQDFLMQRTNIAQHTRRWRDFLSESPDLATNLVRFCAVKV